MPFLLLFITLAQAAKPSICKSDISTYQLPPAAGGLSGPAGFTEGAVRPGLVRVRDDLCRCVPRRKSKWPDLLKSNLWVRPNEGKIRIEYMIDEERTKHIDRMLECMGEPEISVTPMPYKTDVVYTDGRKYVFPKYPLWIYLSEEAATQSRSNQN